MRAPAKSARKIPAAADNAAPARVEIPLEKYITFGLLRVTNRLNRQSIRMLDRSAGLALPEWRCLAFVGGARKISLSEIAERTSMDRGLISRSVQSLVDKGYLLVARDRNDRRIVHATITREGKRVYGIVQPVMQARQVRLLSSLSELDRRSLYRIMDRLNRCLDEWPDEKDKP